MNNEYFVVVFCTFALCTKYIHILFRFVARRKTMNYSCVDFLIVFIRYYKKVWRRYTPREEICKTTNNYSFNPTLLFSNKFLMESRLIWNLQRKSVNGNMLELSIIIGSARVHGNREWKAFSSVIFGPYKTRFPHILDPTLDTVIPPLT